MICDAFELDVEAGVGLTEGQGVDPTIYLSWTDDGKTWSNEYAMPMGELGRYLTRVRWTRLGQFRNRVFQIVVSDPIDLVIVDAFLALRRGTGS